MSEKIPSLKLTLVGDGGVGKSCLILQYMYGEFNDRYEPTDIDAYRRLILLKGSEVQIDILDTAGQEEYTTIRDGYIKHGDGFLLVFDLTDRETFRNIVSHRENILRVKEDDRSIPIILIGNKSDLENNRKVTHEEALNQAIKWKIPYIETSAKIRTNVDKSFSEVLIKIKELKEALTLKESINDNTTTQSEIITNKKTSVNLNKEEEKAVREDSMRKRIRKFYKNTKKRCILM